MLTLPQTAEYALRAVGYIAEHEGDGPVPVSEIAAALGAPQNYLSKTLHHLGTVGVLRSVRGARGGYSLAADGAEIRLATIVEPFLVRSEHRCIMGRPHCDENAPCGAHSRWNAIRHSARAFFTDLTVADLLAGEPALPARAEPAPAVRVAS